MILPELWLLQRFFGHGRVPLFFFPREIWAVRVRECPPQCVPGGCSVRASLQQTRLNQSRHVPWLLRSHTGQKEKTASLLPALPSPPPRLCNFFLHSFIPRPPFLPPVFAHPPNDQPQVLSRCLWWNKCSGGGRAFRGSGRGGGPRAWAALAGLAVVCAGGRQK